MLVTKPLLTSVSLMRIMPMGKFNWDINNSIKIKALIYSTPSFVHYVKFQLFKLLNTYLIICHRNTDLLNKIFF